MEICAKLDAHTFNTELIHETKQYGETCLIRTSDHLICLE